MPVKCGETNIAVLIDTGSSINILSIDLFNSTRKLYLKIRTDKMNIIKTYLLLKTSHPMTLGMNLTRSPTRIFNGEILSFTFLNIFPLDFSTFAFTSFRTISSFFM